MSTPSRLHNGVEASPSYSTMRLASPNFPPASFAPLGRHCNNEQRSCKSRKRLRSEQGDSQRSEACSTTGSYNTYVTDINGARDHSPAMASPASLVNTKYRLSGGLDTPTSAMSANFEEYENDYDSNSRRRWVRVQQDHTMGHQRVTVEALQREGNGRKRRRASPSRSQPSQGWGSYVFTVMGGIAGKFLELWRGNEFSGFQAGGGVGYLETINGPQPIDVSTMDGLGRPEWTPVASIPGQYPEDDDDHSSKDLSMLSDGRARPAKRLQTSQAGDWVVVDAHPDITHSISNSAQKPSVARAPTSGRSVASKRPQHRPGRTATVSHAGSPYMSRKFEASTASARSPKSSPKQNTSPSSIEVQRYQARRHFEERQTDASMRKLNKQLKAMIQEGKAALATKYEVRDDTDYEEDEGFAEADF